MEKHDKNCECHPGQDETIGGRISWKRYVFSILFIVLALLAMRGFILQQLLSRANSYMTYKYYDDATRMFSRIIIIDPNNINARIGLGMAYVQQGKYANAIPQFKFLSSSGKEVNRGPKFDYFSYRRFSLKMLATCYQALGETEKMTEVLKELKRNYSDQEMLP